MPGMWIPERGDLVWITFDPTRGHEQSGRRPALVLSYGEYNEKTGLMLVCPITSIQKGFPFEVPLPPESGIQGVVLSDHVKNIDWRARKAVYIEGVSRMVLAEVLENIGLLIQ